MAPSAPRRRWLLLEHKPFRMFLARLFGLLFLLLPHHRGHPTPPPPPQALCFCLLLFSFSLLAQIAPTRRASVPASKASLTYIFSCNLPPRFMSAFLAAC